MEYLDDIKTAINRLPAQHRQALESWLKLGDHVAETVLDYGTPVEHRRLSVDEYLEFEKLVVEVLSPSTESIDRREKFFSYKQIATVEEYILPSQHIPQITIYRRAGNWAPRVLAGSDAIAVFESIGLSLPLTQIYEGTQ